MVKTMVRLVQLIGMFMKNPLQAVLEYFYLQSVSHVSSY
jgi:hypothetical protein